MLPVSARPESDEGLGENTPATLGDLLYADPSRIRISERDWLALVQSVAKGEQLALQTLFEYTHRIVFTLIMRVIHHRESAEELTLQVFQDVWQSAATYDPASGSVVGWIMNQARIKAENHLSARGGTPGPAENSQSLQAALARLTANERRVIELTFFSELTYVEAATRLAQPLEKVTARMLSGLAKLRKALVTRTEKL
jgi:RNA polymerase sigma-70 factor, ECF subfamily